MVLLFVEMSFYANSKINIGASFPCAARLLIHVIFWAIKTEKGNKIKISISHEQRCSRNVIFYLSSMEGERAPEICPNWSQSNRFVFELQFIELLYRIFIMSTKIFARKIFCIFWTQRMRTILRNSEDFSSFIFCSFHSFISYEFA